MLIIIRIVLILKNITYKIVVFRKGRKIIMPATMDTNESYFMRIYFLKIFAVLYRDQPVFCAMNNIGMAIYMSDPFICAQLIT